MASKLMLTRLRTVTRPSNPFENLSFEVHTLIQIRQYSDPIDPAAAPSPAVAYIKKASKSSLNETELKKFSAIAETWWDAEGPFKRLHVMNPTRLAFIKSTLCRHFGIKTMHSPFEGLEFVDVGCGGGIISEPLAHMGASVMGIDAVEKNIKIAQLHAKLMHIAIVSTEKLVEEQRQFDAVIALEVIEHVANPSEFCKSLSELTSSSGATIISTINRSMRAYASVVMMPEYVLDWLPRGTLEWLSFLTAEELVLILQRASISVEEMAGIVYNPLTGQWSISDDTSVNFIAFGKKTANK